MDHLEPLAWNGPSSSALIIQREQGTTDANDARRCDEAEWMRREHARNALAVRATLRQAAEFLRDVQQAAPHCDRVASAKAALELARLAFAMLAWRPGVGLEFLADGDRCIGDLEGLVARLVASERLSPIELVHAMDDLIGLLVPLDAERRGEALARR